MVVDIKLNHKVHSMCSEFASTRVSGSEALYKQRGEGRSSKIFDDIFSGALGEYAVYSYLNSVGYQCTPPDFNNYSAKHKSFDSDLVVDGDINLHVKSQPLVSMNRYGSSWLLQKSDPLVSNPGANDFFVFNTVDPNNTSVSILGFCKCADIKYGECKVPSWRSTKVAIYLSDNQEVLVESL